MWACLDRNLFSGKAILHPNVDAGVLNTAQAAFGKPSHRLHIRRIAGIDRQSMSRTYDTEESAKTFHFYVSPSSYVRGYIHIIHYADGAGWEFVRDSATV